MVSRLTAFGISALGSAIFTTMLVSAIPTNLPIVNLFLVGAYSTGISALSFKIITAFR